jgi:hypothetical protein
MAKNSETIKESNLLDDESLVEVYAAASEVDARRMVLVLLDEGIEAQTREMSVPEFPTAGTARHLITVFQKDLNMAKNIIAKAVEDEIIAPTGAFLS